MNLARFDLKEKLRLNFMLARFSPRIQSSGAIGRILSVGTPWLLIAGAFLALGAPKALGAVIINQKPVVINDPGTETIASQSFPSPDGIYSSLAFDDFSLTQTTTLSSLLVYGYETAVTPSNNDIVAQIWSAPEVNVLNLLKTFNNGTEDANGNLLFDLTGTGTTLDPGTYWVTAHPVRAFEGEAQWYRVGSNDDNGAPAVFQNPGGGLGVGPVPSTAPIVLPHDSLPFAYRALAFKLEGASTSAPQVPGPLPILGAAAAFASSRRLRARITASKARLSQPR